LIRVDVDAWERRSSECTQTNGECIAEREFKSRGENPYSYGQIEILKDNRTPDHKESPIIMQLSLISSAILSKGKISPNCISIRSSVATRGDRLAPLRGPATWIDAIATVRLIVFFRMFPWKVTKFRHRGNFVYSHLQ
jgi:hypothetical protein